MRALALRGLVVTAVALLAACGGLQVDATLTAIGDPTASPAASPASTLHAFDMCSIVSEGEVIAKASYPIPFLKSEGPTDTACAYYFNDQDHAAASITLGADSSESESVAHDGIMQTVNNYKADNWPTESLAGLGDEAWWVCQTAEFGECTLYVRVGTYTISALMTPSQNPPLDNDLRKGVALELVKLVMSRLP